MPASRQDAGPTARRLIPQLLNRLLCLFFCLHRTFSTLSDTLSRTITRLQPELRLEFGPIYTSHRLITPPPTIHVSFAPVQKPSQFDMAVMGNPGAERARGLLNGIPDRFNDFCHMDQITFVQLADWLVEHADRTPNVPQEISVEESLFVFLDIVAQGNSFRNTAYNWSHDIKLTQRCVSLTYTARVSI